LKKVTEKAKDRIFAWAIGGKHIYDITIPVYNKKNLSTASQRVYANLDPPGFIGLTERRDQRARPNPSLSPPSPPPPPVTSSSSPRHFVPPVRAHRKIIGDIDQVKRLWIGPVQPGQPANNELDEGNEGAQQGAAEEEGDGEQNYAFREDPLHFFHRKYPSDEPHEPNEELRKSLNEDTIGLALHIHEALMQFAGADYAASKADVLHDTLNLLFQGNEPTTGMDRMAFAAPSPGREDKKHVAILRACHRLVNEKVLYRILKSEEGERVESLTKIELAERFSHLSQRPY
jgi:hypothetical protein